MRNLRFVLPFYGVVSSGVNGKHKILWHLSNTTLALGLGGLTTGAGICPVCHL
ncbi:hypothetical protein IF2G_07985 [Cordyceps javanica]|nr:hypothetical protein IF2G_07985 [Cordyceps javanica]